MYFICILLKVLLIEFVLEWGVVLIGCSEGLGSELVLGFVYSLFIEYDL